MKKIMTILSISLLSLSATAASLSLGIVKVEEPVTSTEPYLAFATDGAIYEVDSSNDDLVETLRAAHAARVMVEVKIEDTAEASDALGLRSKIEAIKLLSEEVPTLLSERTMRQKDTDSYAELQNDYISDVGGDINRIFNSMRQNTKSKSQCYNRAHVWSWEIYNQYRANGRKVQTGKVWIFFTRKYIKATKYKWWFHIAPYLKSNGTDMVIDRKFSRQPQKTADWARGYMTNRGVHYGACPRVYKYTDYSQNQWSSYCYVMKTSQHYWQPFNIENAERRNINKKGWNTGEIKRAYKNAVKGYGFLGSSRYPYL